LSLGDTPLWNGGVSDFVDIEYGVRQGSILGPVLFLLHVADMATYLAGPSKSTSTALTSTAPTSTAPTLTAGEDDANIDPDNIVVYADDSNVWVVHKTWAGVKKGSGSSRPGSPPGRGPTAYTSMRRKPRYLSLPGRGRRLT
jgi:hypothetical protein